MKGVRAPWSSILLLITVVRVYSMLYTENAKGKRHWKNNQAFCHIFIIGGISIRRGGGSPGYAYEPKCYTQFNDM